MQFAAALSPPLLTADLPGIAGRIKVEPEDFEVEEIPAYLPSGSGEFLYLRIEKRDLGAQFFLKEVARRLGIAIGEVGSAGLKDRRAVTRQWISVPASAEASLAELDGNGLRVLEVSRHGNKLRAGHLHGNRFRIVVRETLPDALLRAVPIVERLRAHGLPNFYGRQRFGRDGDTHRIGLDLLNGTGRPVRNPFLRKLSLSAVQSALFNESLARRLADGLARNVLPGDVMGKLPFGGIFVAEDVAAEQARFDRREIITQGPIFGAKMFPARADAAAREAELLVAHGLSAESFRGFGKLLQGTRRHNLVYLDDLTLETTREGVRLTFTLPAGSYATVLLAEIMKSEIDGDDQERDA